MNRHIITPVILLIALLGCSKDDSPNTVEKKYDSEDITFVSAGLTLEGTLFLPTTSAKVPAAVIVNGSGPLDRDGIVTTNPTLNPPVYKDWADFLASNEIAVLRYDKRFITHPNLNILELSQEDQIADVIAALDYLDTRDEIDKDRVFVIGHSEGGNLAPVAAQRKGTVAGVVIIAATAFAIDSLVIEQLEANSSNPQSLIDQVKEAFRLLRNNQFPQGGQIFGTGEAYWREWIDLSENARTIASGLGKPIFVLQGAEDENFPGMTLAKNRSLWESAANESVLISFEFYQGVTHSLLYPDSRQIAGQVLEDIGDWINAF